MDLTGLRVKAFSPSPIISGTSFPSKTISRYVLSYTLVIVSQGLFRPLLGGGGIESVLFFDQLLECPSRPYASSGAFEFASDLLKADSAFA